MSTHCIVEIPDGSDFSINNLPYGVYSLKGENEKHIGVAIGTFILDLNLISHMFDDDSTKKALKKETLNEFMSLGYEKWKETRKKITEILTGQCQISSEIKEKILVDQAKVNMHLPAKIGDYTDFYSSIDHATNVGTMFRGKDNALMPNWKWIPVGYHGRASSVVVSGTKINRPKGQVLPPNTDKPIFKESKRLDIELEVAFFVGSGNKLGEPITMKNAHKHIFGVVLMNDWSARDIQKWEYVPLGPFLSKSFATSISPWVVTMEALMPFAGDNPEHDVGFIDYLKEEPSSPYTFDVNLEVVLKSKTGAKSLIIESNMKYLYWTMKHQLVHHTINGCNLNPGDLLGSGTISGPVEKSFGSLLELTWNGTKPISISKDESRTFVEDFDEVIIKGYTNIKNKPRIGFGECSGQILPSI